MHDAGSCDGRWGPGAWIPTMNSEEYAWPNCEPYEWPSTCSSTNAAPAVAGSEACEAPAVGGEASAAPRVGRWTRRLADTEGPAGAEGLAEAAAVAASDPPPGVFGPAPTVQPLLKQTVTMAELTELRDQLTQNKKWRGNWKQHNAALKWFRDVMVTGRHGAYHIMWFADEPVAVATMIHAAKGPTFHFDEPWTRDWDWKEMLCQLDEDSLKYVVEGPNRRSSGVTGCAFAVRAKSYCHLMHHNALHEGQKLKDKMPEYDFIIFRSCGTAIRLHPEWKTTAFRCYELDPHATEVPIPLRGMGTSEGRGTVKKYKGVGVDRMLRFDHTKGEEKGYPGERE